MSRTAQGQGGRQQQAMCKASLFGGFHLRTAHGSEIVISNRRARVLLAMLCLDPDTPLERSHLSKTLWPGRFEAHAKASLRQCLLDVGKLLEANGCRILSVTRDRVSLIADTVQTDLVDLEQALAAGDVEPVSTMLHDIGAKPLLDQMQLGDNFERWLDARRAEIEHRIAAGDGDIDDAGTVSCA
jgi:DNA-binding SARP family transcriptional activator